MKNYYRDENNIIPFRSVVCVWYDDCDYIEVEISLINKEVVSLHDKDAERFLIEYKEWLENDK